MYNYLMEGKWSKNKVTSIGEEHLGGVFDRQQLSSRIQESTRGMKSLR